MEHPRPRTLLSRPLVLMVDGNEVSLALYALALSAMGFDLIPAQDCAEALTRASATSPDIIVTELALRHASGWDLIERLRREPRTRDIPVVVLAGAAESPVRERARREGCAAVIVRPCSPDRLALELREILLPSFSRAHASSSN